MLMPLLAITPLTHLSKYSWVLYTGMITLNCMLSFITSCFIVLFGAKIVFFFEITKVLHVFFSLISDFFQIITDLSDVFCIFATCYCKR